jgi:hypothetical protein
MEMLNTSRRYSPVKQSGNGEVNSEIRSGGRQWQLVTVVGGKLTILSMLETWSGFDARIGVEEGYDALYRRLKTVRAQRKGVRW